MLINYALGLDKTVRIALYRHYRSWFRMERTDRL